MVKLQLSRILTSLQQEHPQLDFDSSGVSMILVDKEAVISLFQSNKDRQTSVPAEVYGYCLYRYSFFDIRLNWKVESAPYYGVHGVSLKEEKVMIEDVQLRYRDKVVRLYNQDRLIDEVETLDILQKPFVQYIQDWRLFPFLSAHMMQPTHYKSKKVLVPGVIVEDIVEIADKTYPQLKKQVIEGGGYQAVNTFCEAVSVENQFICMEGFTTYRLGSEKQAYFAHVHWLVRGNWEQENQFEIAIVESDNLPGALFTGVNIIDTMDEGRDVFAVMRLLKFEHHWKQEAIKLLKQWLADQGRLQHSSTTAKNTLVHSNTVSKRSVSKTTPRLHKNSQTNSPIQLGLFGDDLPECDFQKFTVLDGHKPLKFSGLHIGQVVGTENANGKVEIFDLYKTENNQWVGVKRQVSLMNHDAKESTSQAEYLSDKDQLFAFFEKEVANDLYNQAQNNDDQSQNKLS